MESIRLWVDDERPAPAGWVHVKTAVAAIEILGRKHVAELALDHDLGHCEKCTGCHGYKSKCGCNCHWSGFTVAMFMASTGRWPDIEPTCHSANPAGRANIEATIKRYFGRQMEETPGEFRLTWQELERAHRFQKRHVERHGGDRSVSGGMFSYRFTPTSIDTVASVSCASCRKRLTLTDYSDLF